MSSSNDNEADKQVSEGDLLNNEKLLPWLVNETLTGKERDELELALEKSEKLRTEKAFLTRIQQQVKEQAIPDVPVEFAWQKLKRTIDHEKQQKVGNSSSVRAEKRWRNIAMAASVLLIVQTSSNLISWDQKEGYRPLSSDHGSKYDAKNNAALFSIQFVQTASAIDIQRTLRKNNLSIISGPSSIGLYRVSGTKDSLKDAKTIINQLKLHKDVISHVQQDK